MHSTSIFVEKPHAKNAPFEPQNAVPNDANVHYRGGMAYHYVTLGDDVVTVPTFNLSMFIDVAHTGGERAMTQAPGVEQSVVCRVCSRRRITNCSCG